MSASFIPRPMDLPFFSRLASLMNAEVQSARPLSGGDTARAFRVELAGGQRIFAKTHPTPPSPTFFDTEAAGLQWLAHYGDVSVPEVLCVADAVPADEQPGDGATHQVATLPALLALEWIDEASASGRSGAVDQPDAERVLGTSLARTHRDGPRRMAHEMGEQPGARGSAATQPCFVFGRPDHRPTGSLGLPNPPTESWPEFYAGCRLEPLMAIAADRRALPDDVIAKVGAVARDLDTFGASDETAALLHGDLWAGNRLRDADGHSVLIDPAVHGGHREYDLAMMRLFGGFGETCFEAYDAEYPLADGWRDRVVLHQLAPLVVHAIKFGGPYVATTARVVEQLLYR